MAALIRQKLPEEDQGRLRALQIGTFITADQTGHFNKVPEANRVCKFCKQPDSLYHRHWQCSGTQELRDRLPVDTQEWVKMQPQCTKERAWPIQVPECQAFQLALQALPNTTGDFLQEVPGRGTVYAFTDGSGVEPNHPAIRLVAWAWTAHTESQGFVPVAAGGVVGMQTVVRAETCSAISALKFANLHGRNICIASDNQLVVNRLKAARSGYLMLNPMTADLDLWQVLKLEVDSMIARGLRLDVVKVHSHQSEGFEDPVEEWFIAGNESADAAAQQAFRLLPPQILQAQTKAAKAYHQYARHYRQVVNMFVAVGHKSVETADAPETEEVQKPAAVSRALILQQLPGAVLDDRCFLTTDGSICLETVVRRARGALPQRLVWQGTGRMLDWMATIQDNSAAVEWVAFSDLMVHWMLNTGARGVRCVYRKNSTNSQWEQLPPSADLGFNQMVTNFSQHVGNILKQVWPSWRAIQHRPSSWRYRCWTSALPLKVVPGLRTTVDRWFEEHGVGVVLKMTALRDLPAPRD